MSHRVARVTIDMSIKEHRRLKMAASMMDISMKDLMLMSFEEFMEKRPNKVTEKVLKQSKAGKNLKKFDNLNDLFEDLGI
ncbi:MAG: hypothetical protein JSS61_05870 [Verrucomicrobia bacterium]|nr:hypothetical protein [Verrucomicrobiota bacterium]